jgi:hypothetical protein
MSEVKQLLRDGPGVELEDAAHLGSCQLLTPVRPSRKMAGKLAAGTQVRAGCHVLAAPDPGAWHAA